MTDKDTIFKILNKEELAKANPAGYSYIGWEGTGAMAFYLFAEDYHMGAETLYERMVSCGRQNEILDGLVYPLIFSHRHFCELMLKGIYFEFSNESEENLKNFLNSSGHDLIRIWKAVKPLLSHGKQHVGSKINIGAVEHYLAELNSYDPDSMAMRYPITKNLGKMLGGTLHLDFHNFHNRMEELYDALNQIKYDISNQTSVECTDEEIDGFRAYIDPYIPKFKDLLAILKPLSEKEYKDEFEAKSLFSDNFEKDLEEEPSPHIEFIFNNGDDFLMLVETFYNSGRLVLERQVKLSKNPEESQREFISECIKVMKWKGFVAGKAPNKSSINIHCKVPSSILRSLTKSLELLRIL